MMSTKCLSVGCDDVANESGLCRDHRVAHYPWYTCEGEGSKGMSVASKRCSYGGCVNTIPGDVPQGECDGPHRFDPMDPISYDRTSKINYVVTCTCKDPSMSLWDCPVHGRKTTTYRQWDEYVSKLPNTNASVTVVACDPASKDDANSKGPSYYKGMPGGIQTWDYILAHNLGFLEGCIIKYVTRYKEKGWRDDLLKAKAFLDKLLEVTPEARTP